MGGGEAFFEAAAGAFLVGVRFAAGVFFAGAVLCCPGVGFAGGVVFPLPCDVGSGVAITGTEEDVDDDSIESA